MSDRRRRAEPDLVVVAETDITEAQMIVERLRNQNIPAMIKGEAYLSVAMGGLARVSVLVPRAYHDQVEDILGPDVTAPPDSVDSR
jgi:hypothetical protein